MSIPASAVPAVRLLLLSLLQAALTDQNLLVCLDEPMTNAADDVISIGDVTNTITPYAMIGDLGAGSHEETFDVLVTCEVYRGGDNAALVFGQAAILADQVMSVVRTNPTFAGAVSIVSRPVGVDFASDIPENADGSAGRRTRAEIHIRCSSSL